ncbi:MAG: hypothetical protein MZV70_02140 [Desulfobacterales bacterium]|nr:hypothetical protein [Desulfobacterales bacterium]
MFFNEEVAYAHTKDGITQKFISFIIGNGELMIFIDIRAMGECGFQQSYIAKIIGETFLQPGWCVPSLFIIPAIFAIELSIKIFVCLYCHDVVD